jgi:hypothetical protein
MNGVLEPYLEWLGYDGAWNAEGDTRIALFEEWVGFVQYVELAVTKLKF